MSANGRRNRLAADGLDQTRPHSHLMEIPPGFDDERYFEAVCTGDLSTLQDLVARFEHGIGPGKVWYPGLMAADDGGNGLHFAAISGKTSMCRYLVEKLQFNVNTTNDDGETPLFLATTTKSRSTIIFLINSGADVNKCTISGDSPLHVVATIGTKELVELLVSKGADLYAASGLGMPLHCAASAGNRETLKCLLDLKANPNPTSVDMTPLFLALNAKSLACVELLLKEGADPNRPCHRATPLRYAASALDEEFIKRLLKAGANPNVADFMGHTPLEHAALYGRGRVVRLLFPVTSRIEHYPNWSPRELMKYAQSNEAKEQYKAKLKEVAQFAKSKGRDAYERKRYAEAVNWYIQAIEADPTDAKALYNRSLCYTYANIGKEAFALADAQACIELEPGWAKAHYREGAAWKALKNDRKSAESFSRALALAPDNKEIQEAHREAMARLNEGQ